MSYEKTYKLLAAALADADPVTKAWGLELMRIGGLADREPWEDVLLDLTEQLEPTMKKIRYNGELNEYDQTTPGDHDDRSYASRTTTVIGCTPSRRD
jgi:hypothetical protein